MNDWMTTLVNLTRQLSAEGDDFGAATIAFVGSIHATGRLDLQRELSELAKEFSERAQIDKPEEWPDSVE